MGCTFSRPWHTAFAGGQHHSRQPRGLAARGTAAQEIQERVVWLSLWAKRAAQAEAVPAGRSRYADNG